MAHLCTLLEVWVLGVGMSTLGAPTAVRRVSGAPSADGPGAWQHCGDSMLRHIVPLLVSPDCEGQA